MARMKSAGRASEIVLRSSSVNSPIMPSREYL